MSQSQYNFATAVWNFTDIFQKSAAKVKVGRLRNSKIKLLPPTLTPSMSSYDPYGANHKPDPNCRTCTDFSYWSKQQQRQIFHKPDAKDAKRDSLKKPTSGSSSGSGDGDGDCRKDCPLDKSELGKATWGLLHTIAAFYDDRPTETQKRDMCTFFDVLSRVYPCEFCAKDFQKDLGDNPVNVNSQRELSQWLCNFHNRVNDKLGKPAFDCSKVNERWRDGWLDGSCD